MIALATEAELKQLAPLSLDPRAASKDTSTPFSKIFDLQLHFDALGGMGSYAAADTAIAAKVMNSMAPFSAIPFEALHALLFRAFAQTRVNVVGNKQLVSSEDRSETREVILAHTIYPMMRYFLS